MQDGQGDIRVHRTQTWEPAESVPHLLMWVVSGNLRSPFDLVLSLSFELGFITHHRVQNSRQLAGQRDYRHTPTAPGGQPIGPGS